MRRSVAILASLLVCPAIAAAQEPAAPTAAPTPTATPTPTPTPTAAPSESVPPPAREPVEVRVIGNKPDSLQRIPGSGTIISSKEIQDAEPYDAAEMLNRVPGLTARQEQEGGARLDIGVHGLDPGRSRHILMLEDGIPVTLNPYAEPDLYIAPQIDRMRGIEVVKGSGTVLFGPQTIGGVINFLTLNPPARESVAVAADYGSYQYRRVLAQYGNTFGSARYLVQADYKGGDGARDAPFQSIDSFGKLAFDTSKTGQITLKLEFHDDLSIAEDVGLTRDMFNANPGMAVLDPYDQMHQRRYAASATYEEHLGDSTTMKTLAYAYETQRLWRRQDFERTPYDPSTPASGEPAGFQRFVGDFNTPGSGIYFLNSDTILDRTYDVAGLEPRFETRFHTGDAGHRLEYGARVLGETAHYQQRNGNLYDSDSGANTEEETHRTIAVSGFVQDTIAFRDDLIFTPGLRLEHADFHRIVLRQPEPQSATNPCPAGQSSCATDVNLAGDYTADGFIPGVGMIYGSRDNHVFGGLHVGWSPPRVADSFSPNGMPLPVSPEKSINYELGTRVAPEKWLRGEVTGFVTLFQNEVVAGSGSSAQLTDGGPTRHYGAEAAATVGIGRALKWKTMLDVITRYTFAHATFVGGQYNDNFVPYAPLHTFNVVADVEHPIGFGGQVAFYYIGEQFADQTNIRAEDATGQYGLIPAHTDLDANVHYRNKPTGLTFRLAIKDAMNDVYITERRPQGIATGGFRTILLGMRWDWEAKPKAEE